MVLYFPESLWTSFADGRVRLRIDNSCPQTPITVHQMFKESLEKYGSLNALASKKNGKWEKITFSEYYSLSRKAAKSFLKVGPGNKTNSFNPFVSFKNPKNKLKSPKLKTHNVRGFLHYLKISSHILYWNDNDKSEFWSEVTLLGNLALQVRSFCVPLSCWDMDAELSMRPWD